MSECLSRLIGLDGCTSGTEPFKLNQIGYSREQVSEFMDESFSTLDEFFESAVETAIKQIESDSLTFLPSPRNGVTMLENETIASEVETLKVQTQTGFVGIKIEVHNTIDFIKLNLSRVRLFADFTGTRTIEIRNLNTGQLLDSFAIEAVQGEIVEILVDVSVKAPKQAINLWIGYDSQGASSFRTTTGGCSDCGNRYWGKSGYLSYSGAGIASPYTRSALTRLDHTGGLMIDYNIECDTMSFLCTISGLIGLPLLYKTAMVILEYGLRSGGQFSEQKTLNQENNQERYAHATAEYQKYLNQNLGKARISSSRCFYCAPKSGIKNYLPA